MNKQPTNEELRDPGLWRKLDGGETIENGDWLAGIYQWAHGYRGSLASEYSDLRADYGVYRPVTEGWRDEIPPLPVEQIKIGGAHGRLTSPAL